MPTRTNATDFSGLFDGRPQPEHYTQPQQDGELVQQLQDWINEVEDYRGQFETSWKINNSFQRGDQLLGRHKITGEIVRLSSEDSRRLKVRHNVLAPTVRSLVGKLSAMIPTFNVQPSTADFEERQAALAADSILQLVREQLDLDQKYEEANSYLPSMGNAFLYLTWDSTKGRRVSFCEACAYFTYDLGTVGTPCPNCTMQKQAEQQIQQLNQQTAEAEEAALLMNELPQDVAINPQELMQGQQSPQLPVQQLGPLPPEAEVPQLQEATEGDICVKVLSPFDVYVSPGVTHIKLADRWGVREVISVSQACKEYPEFASFFTPDTEVELDRARMLTQVSGMLAQSTADLKDHLFRWTFYEAPTETYSNGRMIIMVNDVIVQEVENPYFEFNRPNLYHFGFDRILGEFYYEAPISHAWERQRELNLVETQGREGTDLALRRKMFAPIGSGITVDELRSDTQQVIPFNASAGPPIIDWKGPELPQTFWARKQDLVQDIRQQLCVTEADTGMLGSDPNGRALAISTAEADKTIGPIIRRNNAEYRDMHHGLLLLYQMFAHEERQEAIPGEQGCAIVYFREIKLLKPGFRLMLHEEDGLSRNPAVRLQQAISLLQATSGMYFTDKLTGQFDKKAFARMAKLRVNDAGADQQATEEAAASKLPMMIQQENYQWKPRLFDVPHIWADTLEDWLRGPGRSSPMELSVQIEQIWLYYKQWAIQTQMAGGQLTMPPGQAPGQAPGMGGPSQPGQDTSAPGGSPQAPGNPNAQVAAEADAKVKQADAAGEQASRQAANNEA